MCPAARCALTPAGHAGPALHGDSALCGWADRVVRPYDGDGKRVRRDGGDAVSYGWCTVRNHRAGPMCSAARCALTPAGHAGPALHGDSALCRWADRVVRPYDGDGKRVRRDVEDAVPYETGQGVRAKRADRVVHPYRWDVGDAVPRGEGRRGRRPLRTGSV